MTTVLCVGLTTVDVIHRVADFPAPGGKVQSADVRLDVGGPAANAARTIAALGHEAILLTALGDELGDVARAHLDDVEVHDAGPGGPALSTVVVREHDGERTVVSRNAATFTPTRPFPTALVDRADTVLLDGHLAPLALAAARAARSPVLLDAGSWKPVLAEILPLTHTAACGAEFPLTAEELHARGVKVVTRTHGPDPVTWSTGNVRGEVPVDRVEAHDTNGAGDVWHGAFAVADRADLTAAIIFANTIAALRVRGGDWLAEVRRT
ncbi:PfkB family carbohydrate kinase [Saccharothrix violaceirubra]|uniref:Sugar/nucleoside kinase (Ribokinase family) n=1 Tax=Saccharothrix violaceirubra TaxID=413306 RepID=A0A7W7TAE5_9PSEU|nr:PfkB family carbohydrate kinase [Saccharothrix violaceirubra]MBB4969475.1 sugar/nucleoside kinase (ribokinase family) [Saccharothrix violaceirubra]